MPVTDLGNSVSVVTGAGAGIGAATARRLARAGSTVVCLDIDWASAHATAERCSSEGLTAHARGCDVADYDAVATIGAEIESDIGPVAVVVNNAGVFQMGAFLDHDLDDWEWMRSINLDGVVHGCHVFGKPMLARGRGQIVNIASAAAFAPLGTMNLYATTKAAVLMFSTSLRADWARRGVGVTAICPGVISTRITDRARLHGSIARRQSRLDTVLRTVAPIRSPDRVADAVLRAAKKDPDVVMVGIEGHLGHHGRYLLPKPIRERIARSRLVEL